MQSATAEPREALTEQQVLDLLELSPAVSVGYGADVLDLLLNKTANLDLVDGTVARNYLANIHGTCDLEFDGDFDFNNDLVRPWMEISDGLTTARFWLGVYVLTTPQATYGAPKPATKKVQGYDRLYLLSREVGDTYVAPSGAYVLEEVRRAISEAGLGGVELNDEGADEVLPSDMIWPLVPKTSDNPSVDETASAGATTWLRIVNDLLFSIGYGGLYADPASGVFRAQPYVNPLVRTPEHDFDFDSTNRAVISPDRSRTDDQFKAPNIWIFVRQTMPGNPPVPPVEGSGVYTVDLTSIDERPLPWPQQITLDVSSQSALQSQGDARVAADRRGTTSYSLTTAPWPLAGHADVYTFSDQEQAKVGVPVLEASWSLPLNGADMTRTWNEIIPIPTSI